MVNTIFDPDLNTQFIASPNNSPTGGPPANPTNNNETWYNNLISQLPNLIGVFMPNPNTQAPATGNFNFPAPQQQQQNMFTVTNMIIIAVIIVGILFAYKFIQKL